MRITYNSPVVLTYTLISLGALILSLTVLPDLMERWFLVPGKEDFSLRSIRNIVTLVTHAIGHADFFHFISNFSLLLILGPMLEEHYGSLSLLFMMFVTALVTGVLNVFFFSTALLGASGVVFMLILLASFTNFRKGEIPLTFILVLILYVGGEAVSSFDDNNISEFAHIIGGVCGSLFGFQKAAAGGGGTKASCEAL
ncbi:MAG: rhomboid family intramembrane serine protease [Spirochaetaceae bacterium]|jgi:membrane associated rhomboid family serine protease|nr:rhomboid family intramembrane serine protease [Spirochaetaceae bacterium]